MDELTKWTYSAVLGSSLLTMFFQLLLSVKLNRQLETQKALLQRATTIHERRIDVLSSLHGKLKRAQLTLQKLVSGSRITYAPGGGRESYTEEDLGKLLWTLLSEANNIFLDNELLIPRTLVKHVEKFFRQMNMAQFNIDVAKDFNYPNDDDAKAFWRQASDAAYGDLQELVRAIGAEARDTLHSAS